MATVRTGRAVLRPNFGLYLGIPPLIVPERGMQACRNVRVAQERLEFGNMGWTAWPAAAPANLDGKPVLLIDRFAPRLTPERQLFGNGNDLFTLALDGTNELLYITPRVDGGTASWSSGSTVVTGQGTTWLGSVKAGDYFFGGSATESRQSAAWRRIVAVNSDTSITLANPPATSKTADPYTIRSVFSGGTRQPYSVQAFLLGDLVGPGEPVNLGDRVYITNGVDPVVAWDGVSHAAYRPDLGDVQSAKALARFRNVMIYLAPTIEGVVRLNTIRTSAIGQPENTVSLEAAQLTATDDQGEVLTAKPLGELLAIYSRRGITMAQFVGQPTIFAFRTAVSGFGPIGARALVVFPDRHLFIGRDACYLFDGVNAQPIDAHVWRDLIPKISPLRRDFIHAVIDELRSEVTWALPLNTDADIAEGVPETGLVSFYAEDPGERVPSVFALRDFPAQASGVSIESTGGTSWNAAQGTWQQFSARWNELGGQPGMREVLFGDALGNIFALNSGNTANGAPLQAFARFSRRPLANGTARKGVVRRVYPFIEESPDTTHTAIVSVRLANAPDGPSELVFVAGYPVALGHAPKFLAVRRAARYIELEISATSSLPFRVLGYDIDSVPAGERT